MEKTIYTFKGKRLLIRPANAVDKDITQIKHSIANGFYEFSPQASLKFVLSSVPAKVVTFCISVFICYYFHDGIIFNSLLCLVGSSVLSFSLFYVLSYCLHLKAAVYSASELDYVHSFKETYFSDIRCGIWVAVPENEPDKIVGSVALRLPDPKIVQLMGLRNGLENSLELCRMYVQPMYRGTGMATLLLEKAMAHARLQQSHNPSIKALVLLTLMSNASVIRFYTREKWQCIKIVHFRFGCFFHRSIWCGIRHIE